MTMHFTTRSGTSYTVTGDTITRRGDNLLLGCEDPGAIIDRDFTWVRRPVLGESACFALTGTRIEVTTTRVVSIVYGPDAHDLFGTLLDMYLDPEVADALAGHP